MRTYIQAQAMAESLRDSLAQRKIALSDGDCLEIVARQFGFGDWKTLSTKIDLETGARPPPPRTPGIEMQPGIPVLRIFSVEKAKEFYVGFLGFAFDWGYDGDDHDLPMYAQVSRAGITLHLSEHYGDGSPGAAVFIRMTGIDVFHRELSDRKYRFARPGINFTPYDTREIAVTDPFGNRLRFSESNPPGVAVEEQ
jgi:catechol 2,3-dioxygenase-like lactoylglutathione lyase family enzyme